MPMSKFVNPLPQALPKECAKAEKILKSFVDSANNGLDGVIPRSILERASGFAIFTIIKAGFLFSARGGAGIVIARLDDGSWSAPSAIGLAGVGVGGQAGAEMTDFLIVLNSRSAVRSFMAAGSLTLGGNMSLAVGPLGRNGEAATALNTQGKLAAMYSYSKTRGLFGGVSVEGSVIVERQDANSQAYHTNVGAKQILSGGVTPPDWAQSLIHTLESCTSPPGRAWVADDRSSLGSSYAFGGIASSNAQVPSSLRKQQRKPSAAPTFPPDSWSVRANSGSHLGPPEEGAISGSTWDYDHPPRIDDPPPFETRFESDFIPGSSSHTRHIPGQSFDSSIGTSSATRLQSAQHSRTSSSTASAVNPFYSPAERESDGYDITSPFAPTIEEDDNPFGPGTRAVDAAVARYREAERDRALSRPLARGEGVGRAIALYDFRAVEPGDLSFSKGQVVTITEKSDSTDTWWKGKLDGREGSFPANFVEIV